MGASVHLQGMISNMTYKFFEILHADVLLHPSTAHVLNHTSHPDVRVVCAVAWHDLHQKAYCDPMQDHMYK